MKRRPTAPVAIRDANADANADAIPLQGKKPPHHPCLNCRQQPAMPRHCLPKGLGGPCEKGERSEP